MIKLLDKSTIDKIAAGEVVERPSSVVKELVENSIDSGATSITVEIKDGGISFIRVTDNGCGIPRDEVKTAYLRHATSKIDKVDDLDSITTLGFRGEALATIAAVSQTEMITKTSESLTGIKYVIHGGEEIEIKEVGVPNGTTIIVRNLFYNTPARKKFLKTPMTEGSYIHDLITKIALSHPEIAVKLIINGSNKLSTTGNGNLRDVIYQLYGKDITNALLKVDYSSGDIKIKGYIAKPFICRGNRGLENYFINKRYIKNNLINKGIEEAFKTYVMLHKYPFAVLNFDLPYENCDVNVHPTKMEFKYNNEKELFESVFIAVREALMEKELIPESKNSGKANWTLVEVEKDSSHGPEPFENKRNNDLKPNYQHTKIKKYYSLLNSLIDESDNEENKGVELKINESVVDYVINLNNDDSSAISDNSLKDENVSEYKEELLNKKVPNKEVPNKEVLNKEIPKNVNNYLKNKISAYQDATNYNQEIKGEQLTLWKDEFLSEGARVKHKLIGQLFKTYWLIEYDKCLYIMDQHAAHEKINYEALLKNFRDKEIYSQQIMPPIVVTVTYQERQAILDNFDLFMQIGYDIEEFGGNEFKINAVPTNLYGLQERTVFLDFVNSLIENSEYVTNDIFVRKLSTMACKAAIKGNQEISFAEADHLVDELLKLDNPYTCPHGRPTIISMSEAEIEKKFRRIV